MNEETCVNLKSGIYKITNVINNKVYIGQSKNIKQRISGHFNNFTTTKSLCNYMWKWDDGVYSKIDTYKQGKPKKSIIVYKDNIPYKTFEKIQDACKDLNIHRSTIERSIKGIAKNSQGFTFKIK